MNSQARYSARLLWVGLALTGALVILACILAAFKSRVGLARSLPIYNPVADFTLTNQEGHVVTLSNLLGHVWVADIIFTRCPGPCLKMTRQMRDLQQALRGAGNAQLVSLTTDPKFDTPAVLKTYAKRFGADFSRWNFLTGMQAQIGSLAIDSLKLTAVETNPQERQSAADLFIHSTIFVVVDKHGRFRGSFETSGDDIDPARVQRQIVAAVNALEGEA